MFEEVISGIMPLDEAAMAKCQVRLDNLTKPLGSLHSFEHLARKMAGINRTPRPRILSSGIVLMNGSYRTNGMLDVFAAHVSAELIVFDVGTENARNKAQVSHFVEKGIKIARTKTETGLRVIGVGMVGEVDSSVVSAVCYWYSKGGNDPVDVLVSTGSPELAGMVGVILGATAGGAAVVLDDVATYMAALIAVRLAPQVKDYLVGSHCAAKPFHVEAMQLLNLQAYLSLDLNVGEGVGAALGISLLQASLHVLNDMKTFGEAEVPVAEDGPGSLVQNQAIRD